MNIFESMINRLAGYDAEAAADEAQAKQERIKFHREHVRNGPSKFKTPSNGQLERARQRYYDGLRRKDYRKQVRAHFRNSMEAAVLRGHLRSVGLTLIDGLPEYRPTQAQAMASTIWLLEAFAEPNEDGQVRVTSDVVIGAYQAGLSRWQEIVGLPKTRIPDDFEILVGVSA